MEDDYPAHLVATRKRLRVPGASLFEQQLGQHQGEGKLPREALESLFKQPDGLDSPVQLNATTKVSVESHDRMTPSIIISNPDCSFTLINTQP